MEELLIDCCKKAVSLLALLKENGNITPEEYMKHIALKQNFLDKCALSKLCLSAHE